MDEDIKIVEEEIKHKNIFIQIDKLKQTITSEEIENLLSRLKTAERMNDVLIEVICNNTVPKEECKECIKEWARKKVEEDIGKVIYEYNGFTIDVMNMNRYYGRVHLLESFVEVIGNIHDNPELLEVQDE